MTRFRYFLPLMALLVGAAILGAPTQAHATFEIALQEAGVNGGAITMVASDADFGAASYSGTYGDFTVKLFGSASDNGATLSDLLASTTSVTNNSGTSKTLNLWVSQTDYTLPAGTPLGVESGLGGSVGSGTVVLTAIFQAYADKNNNLYGIADYTNGPQTASAKGTTFDTGSASGLFTPNGNYSVTSVANLTLSGGGSVNFSDHVNVTPTTAPAPAGMLLALSALPCLGIGTWLRRRKVKVQNS